MSINLCNKNAKNGFWRQHLGKNTRHQHSNGILFDVIEGKISHRSYLLCTKRMSEWKTYTHTHRFRTPKNRCFTLWMNKVNSEYWTVHSIQSVNVRKWMKISLMCILMGAKNVKVVVFHQWEMGKNPDTHTPHRFFAPNFLRSVISHTNYEMVHSPT